MATTSGNDRTQPRSAEPRRAETSGQDVTSRQGPPGPERGIATREPGRRGLAGLGHAGASSPFGLMRRLLEDMDRMFEPFAPLGGIGPLRTGMGGGLGGIGEGLRLWEPRIDLFEQDGHIVVRADLPGVKKDQVQLRLEDDVLYLSGERRDERREEREGYVHAERSHGSFQRAIQLPAGVDPDQVKASFDDGVLEVKVPVPVAAPRGRSIAIGEGRSGEGGAKGIGGGDASQLRSEGKSRGVS